MIGYRCQKCTWWDNRKEFAMHLPVIPDKPKAGFCRRRKAPAITYEKILVGMHPVHDAEEFCGEFKEDK